MPPVVIGDLGGQNAGRSGLGNDGLCHRCGRGLPASVALLVAVEAEPAAAPAELRAARAWASASALACSAAVLAFCAACLAVSAPLLVAQSSITRSLRVGNCAQRDVLGIVGVTRRAKRQITRLLRGQHGGIGLTCRVDRGLEIHGQIVAGLLDDGVGVGRGVLRR